MKIAFIDTKLKGATYYKLNLYALKLVELGHEVSVITLSKPPDGYPENLPYPIISESLNPIHFDRNFRIHLLRVLRKYEKQADVYHINRSWLASGAALYRRLGGKVPVVVGLDWYSFCSDLTRINPRCWKHCGVIQQILHKQSNVATKVLRLPLRVLGRCLDIMLINCVDAFLPVSPAIAEAYSYQNFDRKRMTVIPPPINYEQLRKSKESYTNKSHPDDAYNILYLGRLSSEKGIDILIDAISRLDFPVKLHIVGEGPQRDYLRHLAEDLGISHRVIFHGWVPHEKVADCYLSSQLFIHPARWPEPFGQTILEAMALGVPVIAPDSGGPPWALQGTGLTFRTGDANDLVEKVRLMHGNPSLAASLAEKARERAREFDYGIVVQRLLEVYENVIQVAKTE